MNMGEREGGIVMKICIKRKILGIKLNSTKNKNKYELRIKIKMNV